MALQPDGKIIAAGKFTSFNGKAVNKIARLNSNGSLDTIFKSKINFSGDIHAVGIQSNGKILVGGFFNPLMQFQNYGFARLNNDGTLDSNFHSSSGGGIKSILILNNDKMIIAPTDANNINILDKDGSIDYGFLPDYKGDINALAIQTELLILPLMTEELLMEEEFKH